MYVKLARELERRLERLVDGISATVFRGKMHPVDMANRLLRAIDLTVADGPLGPEIGNDLKVRVHPGELDDQVNIGALEHELAVAVTDLAADRGIRTGGAVRVAVVPDASVRSGSISIDASHIETPQAAWAQLIAPNGSLLELADNRSVVGRADDADAIVSHPEVSRHHALIWRAGGRTHVQDLGSVNGTVLNGAPLATGVATVAPGDQLRFGPAAFTFRVL